MAQIRINPEEMETAAKFVDGKRDEIGNLVAELKSKIDEVVDKWDGAAQSSFVDTFNSNLYPVLNETVPQVMEGLSAQMSGAANAIRQADEEVAKAFRGN